MGSLHLRTLCSPPHGGPPDPNHPNDEGKREWSLTVERPVLLIGDSNLTNFPRCNSPLVQVDSFPGHAFFT